MPRSLRFLFAVIGCLLLCGGHYGVMQGIAWANMLADYSSESGLIEGTRQTFDGEHPCELCTAISDAKKRNSDSSAPGSPRPGNGINLELKPCPLAQTLCLVRPQTRPFTLPPTAEPLCPATRFSEGPTPPPPRAA